MFTPQKSTTVTSSKQNQLLIAALWGDIAIISTLLTDEDIDLNMTVEATEHGLTLKLNLSITVCSFTNAEIMLSSTVDNFFIF
ncbi:MAG: hypothetical protein VXZ73_01210 [Pseudomonadota bacterium]|nr:hypothetical protein [Pseudomonadota bacterium]